MKLNGDGTWTQLLSSSTSAYEGSTTWVEDVGPNQAPLSLYNGVSTDLINDVVNLNNLKLMLLDGTAVFNPADTDINTVSAAGAKEVTGSGAPAGGTALTGVSFSDLSGNKTKFSADSVAINVLSGTLAVSQAVVYDTVTGQPIFFLQLPSEISATTGESIQFNWDDTDGIISFV